MYDVIDFCFFYDGVKRIYQFIKDNVVDDVSLILVGNKIEELWFFSEEDG